MIPESFINIGVGLSGVVLAALGLYATFLLPPNEEAKRQAWKQKRQVVWTGMAICFVLNFGLVVLQSRYQAASAQKSQDDLEGLNKQVTGLDKKAQTSLDWENATSLALRGQGKPESSLVSASVKGSVIPGQANHTIVQAIQDNVKQVSTPGQGLTPAQQSLIELAAAELAKNIKADYSSAVTRWEQQQEEQRKESEQSLIKSGRSKEEAHQLSYGGLVGGGYASTRFGEYRSDAIAAIMAHRPQIESLVSLMRSDKTFGLSAFAAGINDSCNVGLPGDDVDTCTSQLDKAASAQK